MIHSPAKMAALDQAARVCGYPDYRTFVYNYASWNPSASTELRASIGAHAEALLAARQIDPAALKGAE